MKKLKIIPIIIFIGGFICGLTYITYAGTYNSSEISYDNSNSHAEAENVKDAIDYLYSHGFSTCPEDMTCIESPVVTINSSGPGSVDKESMHIRINGSNKFTITPDEGMVLNSITCTKGYTLSSFDTVYSSVPNSQLTQEITVTNPNINEDAICEVKFSTNEISISSTKLHVTYKSDTCNSAEENCACYYIKNGGSNFSYMGHTGCNFKSTKCYYTYDNAGEVFGCDGLFWISWNGLYWGDSHYSGYYGAACSGVITCAT